MRTIAFDVGTVRVGVAVSDAEGRIATPLRMVERTEDARADARALAELASVEQAEQIVVGMPVSLRGKRELAAEQMEAFVALLRECTGLPVVEWDERMTTVIATRALVAGGVKRRSRPTRVDAVAATVLLQSFLDSRWARQETAPDRPEGCGEPARDGAED